MKYKTVCHELSLESAEKLQNVSYESWALLKVWDSEPPYLLVPAQALWDHSVLECGSSNSHGDQ